MLKVEKPENVVSEKRKSFSALFLETLHKKNFFEPPCRGGSNSQKSHECYIAFEFEEKEFLFSGALNEINCSGTESD